MKRYAPIPIIALLLAALPATAAAPDLVSTSNEIDRLLRAGKFKKAESLVEACIAAAPEDLDFLSRQSMVLYGLDRDADAERLRGEILDLWERRYRDNWKARGAPATEASWARMILDAKKYYVYLAEYYEPEVVTLDGVLTRIPYKLVAMPRSEDDEASRVFKLEARRTVDGAEDYSLREVLDSVHKLAVPFGSDRPDVRAVAAETVKYLNEGW